MPRRTLTNAEDQQTVWSLVLGLTIWFLHFNILNMLTSLACKWGWFSFTIAGIPGIQIIEMIISLIALLLMLFMTYLPLRNWRSFQTKEPTHNPKLLHDTEKDRRPLLAFVAMLMNTILSLFVLTSFVLLFFLNACSHH